MRAGRSPELLRTEGCLYGRPSFGTVRGLAVQALTLAGKGAAACRNPSEGSWISPSRARLSEAMATAQRSSVAVVAAPADAEEGKISERAFGRSQQHVLTDDSEADRVAHGNRLGIETSDRHLEHQGIPVILCRLRGAFQDSTPAIANGPVRFRPQQGETAVGAAADLDGLRGAVDGIDALPETKKSLARTCVAGSGGERQSQ
jgi:hypothetical protein